MVRHHRFADVVGVPAARLANDGGVARRAPGTVPPGIAYARSGPGATDTARGGGGGAGGGARSVRRSVDAGRAEVWTGCAGPQHVQLGRWHMVHKASPESGSQTMTKLVIGANGFLGSTSFMTSQRAPVRGMLRRTTSSKCIDDGQCVPIPVNRGSRPQLK